ncbi:beta-lactamase/transpeptidase-like protein [Xylogone sp. PMI_703]|nr:beta-lactamase/transpeptidase-like protein [Xylogone sp. PMI_703]
MSLSAQIQSHLDAATNDPRTKIPGAVFIAIDKTGTPITANVSGLKGLENKTPLTLDSIFFVASCTKLVTAIAALQLVEQGKLRLDDKEQIQSILPELAKTKIINENGEIRDLKNNNTTLRMLMSHTAGFAYPFFNERLRDAGFSYPTTREGFLSLPVLFEPGSSWEYGTNIDIVGILIERVTSMSLEAYFQSHICEPLGITTPSFCVTNDNAARLAFMHNRAPNGSVSEAKRDVPIPSTVDSNTMCSGGAGAFTSLPDYSKILATLLCDGVSPLTHQRILGAEMVSLMFENQVPHLPNFGRKGIPAAMPQLTNSIPDLHPQDGNPPQGWSMAGLKLLEKDISTGRREGSVHWSGISNVYWWLDPKAGIAGILATQLLPYWDAQVLDLKVSTERAVYESLSK